MSEYILEMRNITKEYSGVRVLEDVELQVKSGQIHALVGENGAGKTTMMKILSGVIPEHSFTGEIYIDGEKVTFSNTTQSEDLGISIIYQELALALDLDVSENIFMGKLPVIRGGIINWNRAYIDTKKLLVDLSLDKQGISEHAKLSNLSIGQQQLVEIAKSLSKNARILLLDEPTSALTDTEVEILMDILRDLKSKGVTCIYISHKLEEVMEIADTISVLRDGKMICTKPKKETNENEIISNMVGREIKNRYPKKEHRIGDILFEIKDYNVFSDIGYQKKIVDNVNLYVRSGEVLGIAGLMGSGRTELVTSLFGCLNAKRSGTVLVKGKEVMIHSPDDAIEMGIALVTEDRKQFGLMLQQNVMMNMTIASLKKITERGVINSSKEMLLTKKYYKSLVIKAPSLDAKVESLSGGNQQKLVLAKWLMTDPKIMFLDEPTRGVDVGAKIEIYKIMNDLLENGVAIIMISSELPEVLGISDRIMVMHEGRIKGEFSRDEASQELIMSCTVL